MARETERINRIAEIRRASQEAEEKGKALNRDKLTMEAMRMWGVSRRTAHEYIDVALNGGSDGTE